MTTRKNMSYESELLLHLLAEVEVFAEYPEDLPHSLSTYAPEFRHYGVPYKLERWTDAAPPTAWRKGMSRAAQRLSDVGLLVRRTEPNRDRVTHLQFTVAGLRRALDLVGDRADRTAVYGRIAAYRLGATAAHRPKC